ncbi:unnamed protein product, partial [Staurois parvus]
ISVPKVVTPSYTRAYHAALHRESPAALTLSFAPTMCPLQRPRPSPLADAGIWLLCSGPCGCTGAGGKFENLKKNVIFFKTILYMLCHVPCLHFYCSF